MWDYWFMSTMCCNIITTRCRLHGTSTTAFHRQPTSKALRYGNALSRDLTVLPAHTHVYPRTEWTIPAFAFPAEAGTHLPTLKGWEAELAWATRTVSKQSAQDCYAMSINWHHDLWPQMTLNLPWTILDLDQELFTSNISSTGNSHIK